MRVSTLATFIILALLLSGCQLPYLVSGAVEQVRILNSRKPIKKAIASGKLTDDEIKKLKYAEKASLFAEGLGLNCKKNFKTYVKLDRPYVSYLVIASKKDELKLKKWKFPIVGSFPYLGFFSEKKAKKYQEKLIKQNYDTYLRGASAYSSLGWFNEPILSSMIKGPKESIAETIFHECFHGTFFMKNNVELNERLAVFIAHKSLLLFLKDNKEKQQQEIKSWEDQQIFSSFLKETLDYSEEFYLKPNKHREEGEEEKGRNLLFKEIANNYDNILKPKLKHLDYSFVFKKDLNNAKLLAFTTYFHNFKELNSIYENKFNHNIKKMIYYFKKLNSEKNKQKKLKLKDSKLLLNQ